MSSHKKTSIYWYLFVIANILPVMGVFGGIWQSKLIGYFYWIECALVALFALAMYAKHLIVFFLIAAAIGLIVYLANPFIFMAYEPIAAFWSLYSLCWLGYIEIRRSEYGQKVKRLTPYEQLVIYLLFMTISIVVCYLLATAVAGEMNPTRSFYFLKTFVSVAIIVPTITMGLLKVIDMIGQNHFIDFLKGTYHLPQERNSVVLFLDMVGSSSMAESLAPKQSMELIARFIYDCGFIFRTHGGDILNYTGDGLVVIWPRSRAAGALAATHKLWNHFTSKPVRSRYWKNFGMVPEFRIGIHAGPIVISQIGEEKLFLGLYGDVVNTAARLEQMNKELHTSILVSADVVQGLSQSWRSILKPLGEKTIRGRTEKITVYTIYKDF